MNNFSYTQAASTKEATAAKAADKQAAFIGGGTTLIDLMKSDIEEHSLLIDINRLSMLGIENPATGLRIGALERMSDVGEHPLVVQNYPVISQSLLASASPQLRNMASMGGNLLQRTRCGYFRDTAFPCNKRVPGSGCPAQTGDNRTLAILGGSTSCIATHASDLAVALVALEAKLTLESPKGTTRTVPLADFYKLPGSTPNIENHLAPGELITAITVPAAAHARKSHYLKVRDRASYAYALVSAAVGLDVQGGTIRSARVALGGVGTVPWRVPAVEKYLVGKPATEDNFRAAAALAVRDAKPYEHNKFKLELAQRTIVRALLEVA
ncbi:xanthine dehydrogenase family protein subunit M [Hymenobacter sp. UV11]|uniref:FAD binding domain-containing protein n=1 Tax=Hymenobacter sp. UV11 TaxID=1849735 RepID=UPI00105F1549|nr:xanthine dehydrogenase family protein subunit M [Hymenobacter sp. UV11]TDN36400.1 FAD-binding molybdopterin dehydrogenase [Hymenobacter sp. UV11]TFZ64498.1 xanthine dehydrogenase family protein subunit M [Hymenobacter sp. UV11]